MMVNNSWLQPIVNKLTVWRKQKLCMVSLSLCCQQPGGEEEEIRNYGESVLTAAGSRLLICGHFSLQTSHHDYFLGEKINEQEENQSDRDEHKKRSHTGLNYQMKYLHG